MKKIASILIIVFTSKIAFAQVNNGISDLNLQANSGNSNLSSLATPKVSLIRGEFLGISSLLSGVNKEHNPNNWNDSISQSKIAEIFKIYYHSKPKDYKKSTLKVHSNANNGKVYIGLSADIIDQIRVVDQNGKVVIHQNNVGKSYSTLDFNYLPQGNYYLQVSGNREFSTKQLIKL